MAAAKARVSLLEYRTLEALDYYGSLSAKEIAVKISDKYEYHCDRSAITPRMSPLRIKELIITLPEIRDGSHLHHITEAGRTYLMKRMRRV
jgi:DNA-binding MarR family transcriptional regulator